jgi:hypothetical protein
MGFDISKVGLTEAASNGALMVFTDPSTGLPLIDDETQQKIGVTLRSRLSQAGQAKAREQQARRLEQARRGKDASVEQMDAEAAEFLAALTASWTFTELDGQPYPFSYENALKFWSDPRFRAQREQANAWVNDSANFTTR